MGLSTTRATKLLSPKNFSMVECYGHLDLTSSVPCPHPLKADISLVQGHGLVSDMSELGGICADCSAIAAALVAGVVAEELTWMNHLGQYHPARRNHYIYEFLQWNRPSGLPVLWNGMDGTKPDPRKP